MFATDRDVLVVEPGLFARYAWLGQRVLVASGSISGTVLTLGGGATFAAAGVGVGGVLLLGEVPVEVVAITGAAVATVSLLRAGAGDAAIAPALSGAVGVTAYTFKPQIEIAHRQLMRMIGVDVDGSTLFPSALGGATASMVRNPREVAWVEAVLAARLVLSAQAASFGHEQQMDRSLKLLDARARAGIESLRVLLDTDGDGVADVVRMPSVAWMGRG